KLGQRTPDDLTEAVAEAVEQLLAERDHVTQVLTAMAFARCGLGESRTQAPWGAILRAILDRFDRQPRKLFEDHLERRFRRYDPKSEHRLRQLRDDAGLPQPKTAEPAAGQDTKDTPAELGQRASNIFGKVSGFFRGRLGGSEESPARDKKDGK